MSYSGLNSKITIFFSLPLNNLKKIMVLLNEKKKKKEKKRKKIKIC